MSFRIMLIQNCLITITQPLGTTKTGKMSREITYLSNIQATAIM